MESINLLSFLCSWFSAAKQIDKKCDPEKTVSYGFKDAVEEHESKTKKYGVNGKTEINIKVIKVNGVLKVVLVFF